MSGDGAATSNFYFGVALLYWAICAATYFLGAILALSSDKDDSRWPVVGRRMGVGSLAALFVGAIVAVGLMGIEFMR